MRFSPGYVRYSVGSSSDGLLARLAVPDSDGMSLDSGLSTECADVFGVLCDFHLLDLLSEGGTVSVIRAQSLSAIDFLAYASIPLQSFSALLKDLPIQFWKPSQVRIRRRGAKLKALGLMVFTYLVPYLPVTPTFLVLLVIFAVVR
jgi:hypothetical protein